MALNRDLQLREQLAALRHLRPGTQVPRPHGSVASHLFDDLLALQDDVDVLQWLQTERGQAVALLSLGLALDVATGVHSAITELARHSRDDITSAIERKYAPLYGALAFTGRERDGPSSWVDAAAGIGESDELTEALMKLRHRSMLPHESAPSRSLTDPGREALLADLLRLTDAVELVRWLREHRSALCARLVLTYLLRTSLPNPNLASLVVAGPATRPSVKSKSHLRAGSLSVWVERIDFFAMGFAVRMRARFRRPSGLPPGTITQWEGFGRVADDDGHHYLTQFTDLDASNQFWWWRERLTLVCWPAIGDAHYLHLRAEPAMLSVYRAPSSGGELIPEQSPILGHLSFSVKLR